MKCEVKMRAYDQILYAKMRNGLNPEINPSEKEQIWNFVKRGPKGQMISLNAKVN